MRLGRADTYPNTGRVLAGVCIIVTIFRYQQPRRRYALWFLVHPASKTHWATRFLQLLLSSAASSTSSQLMPIFPRSFLTASFQFCRGRPGLLLKPSGSHVRACRGSLWRSIRERCPSRLRRPHLIMSSSFRSAIASLIFSFVTLSFQEIPRGIFYVVDHDTRCIEDHFRSL